MIPYAVSDVFSDEEMRCFHRAVQLVKAVTDGDGWRCHELARAVSHYLEWPVQDGFFGSVDHSWLWTGTPPKGPFNAISAHVWPNVLDVYVPGSVPQVQLVHFSSFALPTKNSYTWTRQPDIEIDENAVLDLIRQMKEAE